MSIPPMRTGPSRSEHRHEELLPARAIRWTETHVTVVVKALEPPYNQHELIVWLRVEDVFRTIPRRPRFLR